MSPFTTHVCCRDRSNFSTLQHYIYFLRCCPMSTLFTLLHHVYFLPRYCAISTLSTLLRHVYLFNADKLCLLFPRCCALSTAIYLLFPHCYAMSTFSTLLFDATVPCLPFPHSNALSPFPCCCAISTLAKMLHYIYFAKMLRNVYSCHTTALYLPFPRCCAKSSLSILLRLVHFFHTAAPCQSSLSTKLRAMSTFHFYCAMSTLSMLLRNVYFFHGAAPHLLLQHCCSTSPFFTLLRHVCCSIAAL